MDYDQFENKSRGDKKADYGIKINKLDSILIKKQSVIFAWYNANVIAQNKISTRVLY